MKHFGIVKSYDDKQGFGMIKPEKDGDSLRFDAKAVDWGKGDSSKTGRRLSYEEGKAEGGDARAVNLHPA